PDFVKAAAIEAIKSGFTKYTPTTGIPELKMRICDKFNKDNRLNYGPAQIVVSCGAKHSIFNALMVLINRGDEVLIPCPYWVSYPEMVNICEGKPRFIETSAKDSFKLTPADLKRQIHSKTRVLILNSPSNPAGCVYSEEELKDIADICASKKIFVISDEIYEKIMFDGQKHVSVASFGEPIYNLTITVNGLSKSHAMTGWRIGYLGAPIDIAEAISRLQDHSTSNPNSIAQKAAVAALSGPDDYSGAISVEFQKRRDYIVSRLQNIKKLNYVLPRGAFYIFCGISKTGMSSSIFASRLLDEAGVAVIPGDAFGRDDYIRISFAACMDEITKGMDSIEAWLKGL
ncbi:MAG: pyridoxal phosphate-dependent aminotransferase, partial [Candidatus Omnitrophota bacterium]